MTALLACLSGCFDEITPEVSPAAKVKLIPYSVTAQREAVTKVSVGSDGKTLLFEAGDKLFIEGKDIQGTLDLTNGAGETEATFSGTLEYSGDGEQPDSELPLTATLISEGNRLVEGEGYTHAIADDIAQAVSQFSVLSGASTFAQR